jgi:hypothetical protein
MTLWKVAVVYTLIVLAVAALNAGTDLSDGANNMVGGLVDVSVMVVFGLKGNEWKAHNLTRRGFKYAGTVMAANQEEARRER